MMNTMPPKIVFLTLLILFTSCVKDVDFDQSDDLSIQPKYVLSLAYFTLDQHKFIDNGGNEIYFITVNSSAPINTSSIVNENLTKAEIKFKVTNTFNRAFIIVLKLYNTARQETFAFNPITVNPNTTININQIIQGSDLINFGKGNSIAMSVVLLPSSIGGVINPAIQQTLNVQVSGLFYLNLSN